MQSCAGDTAHIHKVKKIQDQNKQQQQIAVKPSDQ
jgi:hypothetical protein